MYLRKTPDDGVDLGSSSLWMGSTLVMSLISPSAVSALTDDWWFQTTVLIPSGSRGMTFQEHPAVYEGERE